MILPLIREIPLVAYTVALIAVFGVGAFTLTRRNRWLWAIVGACSAVALLFPFRAYKITGLDPRVEKNISGDAIRMTKDLVIPGFPNAYNPSLIPYQDGYLLSFRAKYHSPATLVRKWFNQRTAYIGLVRLNHQLELCEKPYLLDLRSYSQDPSSSAQDARLFRFGDKILLFFNDYGATKERSCYSLYVAELKSLKGPHFATRLNYGKMLNVEKNWTPFSSDEKLYLIYSGQPHLILEADLQTGLCKEAAISEAKSLWEWGSIRGGAPAYPVDGGLLTFFHSSQSARARSFFGTKHGRNYVMGAYLFENAYPFSIQKITASPLGSIDDYCIDNRRKVIFPGGMAIEPDVIHVVWGKNDNGICITTFDKEKLLTSMNSISF
jgi:predicted GH43/DUF377 family glycosyl hydrolase